MTQHISESIFQKRIKRFKSMKRGYYSLIILIVFYFISILGPLWMNNKPLIIKYENKYGDERVYKSNIQKMEIEKSD